MAAWRVTVSSDFAGEIAALARRLQLALDTARSASARSNAREELESFQAFQDVYNKLLAQKADPADWLHLADKFSEGDFYALTEHGWQVLYLADYTKRICIALSVNRASSIRRRRSHRAPRLP